MAKNSRTHMTEAERIKRNEYQRNWARNNQEKVNERNRKNEGKEF